eukprot:TRINITY_DN835_c0_g1_i3.p1 TRINITY_DN835_c0_g1~~TRINITY_DN835_c0_g1_i3.p1  ORF type:complete len:258 (+),score=76.24 TRINITY_DN835_c0_g1_i3:73-846(+)
MFRGNLLGFQLSEMLNQRNLLIAGVAGGAIALVVVGAHKAMMRRIINRPPVAIAAVYAAPEAQGSPDAVLSVLDSPAVGLNMSVGPEKGALLDRLVTERAPRVVVEFGAYYGYSAVRLGRLLKDDAVLYSIEVDPVCAAISSKIVEYAGLADRVRVVVGSAATVLPRLRDAHGVSRIDLLFIDHDKEAYIPDLRAAERLGLLPAGSLVVADNMSMATEYLKTVQADAKYESQLHQFRVPLFAGLGFQDGVLVSKRLA